MKVNLQDDTLKVEVETGDTGCAHGLLEEARVVLEKMRTARDESARAVGFLRSETRSEVG